MGFKVKVLKNGKDLKKNLKKIQDTLGDGTAVLAGLPKNSIPYPNGTSVVLVGATHEFGASITVTPQMRGFFRGIGHPLKASTQTIRIPERSFLRATVKDRQNQKKYADFIKRGLQKMLEGKATSNDVASLLGQEVQFDIQQKILEIKDPPNSPMTIQRKKSSNPLIDTGHLRQSIRFEVVDISEVQGE
jgi:hypothetical protein